MTTETCTSNLNNLSIAGNSTGVGRRIVFLEFLLTFAYHPLLQCTSSSWLQQTCILFSARTLLYFLET